MDNQTERAMLLHIDDIINLLDKRRSLAEQEEGLLLAKKVKTLNAFLMPKNPDHNEETWENCAKVFYSADDNWFRKYILELLVWIKDCSCQGASIIYARLLEYKDSSNLYYNLKETKEEALENHDCLMIKTVDQFALERLRITPFQTEKRSSPTKSVVDIDQIFDLLSWKQSESIQAEGVALARTIKNLQSFILPISFEHGKDIWDNCAVILSEKEDGLLFPYIDRLMDWFRDPNWPGSETIWNRLLQFQMTEERLCLLDEPTRWRWHYYFT